MTGQSLIKRLLPRSLLGRSLLIIVTPLVLLQVVSGLIFYESHWDKVSLRLARNLAGDIAGVIALLRRNPDDPEPVFDVAAEHMEMTVRVMAGDILPNTPPDESGLTERMLVRAMREYVGKPFQIDTRSLDRHVVVRVQLTDGVLEVVTTRKRLFSSTTYIFVLWMVGTSMILFGVAVIFMRNQVKPIRRLAFAADTFGKGRDAPSFKPEGAKEVRQAATAFIAMRDRIQRQITQRNFVFGFVLMSLVQRKYGYYTLQAARFTANVLYAILMSNLRLAAIVLSYTVGTAPKLRPGIVAVPLTITNPFDITILATVITLTPGTLSVDLGEDVSGRLWPYSESDDGMIGLDSDEEPQGGAHEQPEAAQSPQSASARDRGAAALLVHAIDVADPQAFRVEIKQNFERPLLELRRILVELDAADT